MTSEAYMGALTLESRAAFGGGYSRAPSNPSDTIQPVAPPPPPEPKNREHGRIVLIGSGIFTAILLTMGVVAFGMNFIGTRLHEPGPLPTEKPVVVRAGSASEIASTLMNERVIDSGMLFWIGVKMLGVDQRLHEGEFLFPAHASIETVIDKLVEGKAIDRFVLVPEGRTSEEVVAALVARDDLSGDIKDIPREGTLLPDNYKITRGDSRPKLLQRMAEAQKSALAEIWKRRSAELPIKSPQELVVLASIVEKETGKADERPRVAGVFMNRLAAKMRLQSDPTIIYGLVGGKGTLGRPLTKDDVAKPTPYNTYAVDGLPPGPIANPGRAAMEAVANPSRTKELYFVADGTGGHVFAETLDQHQRNVARWRQIEADRALANANGSGTPPSGQPAQPGSVAPPGAVPVLGGQHPPAAVPLGTLGVPAAATPAPTPMPAPASPPKPGQKRGANIPAGIGQQPYPQSASALAEPEAATVGSGVATIPLSAAMRLKMEREAAAAGVKLGPSGPVPADALDPDSSIDPNDPGAAPTIAPVASANALPGGPLPGKTRPRAFDAVAGTAKDPLNNKTFDLNSSKTVPNLK
jgi:UPF0755 protein